MLLKNKLFSQFLNYAVLIFFGFLIALGIWTLTYPQELRGFILNGTISERQIAYQFIAYFIFSAALLFLTSFALLKKRINEQNKAMLPLILLLFIPLRASLTIGSQITWFPQTDFYFILFFIFLISLSTYRLTKIISVPKLESLNLISRTKTLAFILIPTILLFGYFSIVRLFDLAIEKPDSHAFITVFWNTAHGDILRSTYLGVRNWFSLHFEPVLFLFAPLFWLSLPTMWPPVILQLIQIVIGVSGAIPVFYLSRRKLRSASLTLLMSFIYLLYPAFQFQILYDFHVEIISLVAGLWSIYFLEEKNYKFSVMFLLFAVLVREEFALYALIFGLFLLFKGGNSKKIGFALLSGGLLYFFLVKFALIPYFGQGTIASAQESMFSHLGTNLSQIVQTLFSKPAYILNFMLTQRKIQYLFLMFLSTGFLALFSPLILLSVPFFALNLLLNFDLPSSIFWHYQSWIIPIILWATIDFVSKKKVRERRAFTIFLLTSTFLSTLFFGPVNILKLDLGTTHKALSDLEISPEIRYVEEVKHLIPYNALLAADTGLAPFFADRKNFYLFPNTINTEYIATSLKMFSRHSQLHTSLTKDGYCLKGISAILLYRKQKKCDQQWLDDLRETTQKPPLNLPLFPQFLDHPSVTTVEAFVEKKDGTRSIQLLDYEVLALNPSKVSIYASPDGKRFHLATTCSAVTDSYCKGNVDISRFIDNTGKVIIKFYLFADSRSAQDSSDVKIDRIVLRTLEVTRK